MWQATPSEILRHPLVICTFYTPHSCAQKYRCRRDLSAVFSRLVAAITPPEYLLNDRTLLPIQRNDPVHSQPAFCPGCRGNRVGFHLPRQMRIAISWLLGRRSGTAECAIAWGGANILARVPYSLMLPSKMQTRTGVSLAKPMLMGHHQHGKIVLVDQVADRAGHFADQFRIKRRCHLSIQHDLGAHGNRAGNRYALLLVT